MYPKGILTSYYKRNPISFPTIFVPAETSVCLKLYLFETVLDQYSKTVSINERRLNQS